MASKLISVDAGNGMTNAVLAKGKSYDSIAFPSVRAVATGDTLELDGTGIGEIAYDYADWGGHRYVVGDDVIRVTRRSIERHQGAQRYGDEFHQFLVSVAIGKLGIKSGDVDLTLFAPPGMFVKARQLMMDRFKNGGVKFRDDKKPRAWTYSSVTVYPEGLGAAACFALDDKGNLTESDILTGETVILDMGMYTLDALQMSDGNFNPESLSTATWENGGLREHIHEPILRSLKKVYEDCALLTVDDIDLVIRQGLRGEGHILKVAGAEIDITPMIEKRSSRYAEWIANNIVDGVFGGLRGIKSCILLGGGPALAEQYLRKWYDDKLLNAEKFETTRGISAVDMNAVGGIRLAKMRQAQLN